MIDSKPPITIPFDRDMAPVSIHIGGVDIAISSKGVEIAMVKADLYDGPPMEQNPFTGFFHPVGHPELARL